MISDISIQFCEYNRSNPDADRIYRPQGSGDYLFLLLKTPMKVYQENGILITGENACILQNIFSFRKIRYFIRKIRKK